MRPPNPLSNVEPWDLVASGYAAEAGAMMGPFSARALELAALGAEAVVLDVAAGPGTLTLLAAPRVARVQAVDFAPAMVEELERALAEQGIPNVQVEVGDGQALRFDERSFDAGFSMFGLMFFPERARGFRELFRVLKPGGVAVVSSWAPVDESSLMTLMFGALRAADPSRPAPQRDLLSLENPELFAEELSQAGFTDVAVHAHRVEYPAVGADELWERMCRSSAPLLLLRKKLGEAVWAEQARVARTYVRERLAADPTPLSTKAFLGLGRRPV